MAQKATKWALYWALAINFESWPLEDTHARSEFAFRVSNHALNNFHFWSFLNQRFDASLHTFPTPLSPLPLPLPLPLSVSLFSLNLEWPRLTTVMEALGTPYSLWWCTWLCNSRCWRSLRWLNKLRYTRMSVLILVFRRQVQSRTVHRHPFRHHNRRRRHCHRLLISHRRPSSFRRRMLGTCPMLSLHLIITWTPSLLPLLSRYCRTSHGTTSILLSSRNRRKWFIHNQGSPLWWRYAFSTLFF